MINKETEHTKNTMQKGALINSIADTFKKNLGQERGHTEPGLVALTTFGQETERIYSYNPGAARGPKSTK